MNTKIYQNTKNTHVIFIVRGDRSVALERPLENRKIKWLNKENNESSSSYISSIILCSYALCTIVKLRYGTVPITYSWSFCSYTVRISMVFFSHIVGTFMVLYCRIAYRINILTTYGRDYSKK